MTDTLKNKLDNLQKTAKERTVKTQNIEYDLETLVKKITKNIIKLDPDYQRKYRWSDDTSSRLIESLILNIPIPLIYLSQDIDVDEDNEEEVARYSVIDGQQRLTSIVNFMNGKYSLSGLDILEDLNGSFYKDLPPFLIRRLEERTIKCLRIDSTVDSQVKYDIFERLNSGSVQLETQELRNAVYRGPFNSLIKELAKIEDFRVLIKVDPKNPEKSTKVKKMIDVELVLRFFAFSNGKYLNYNGELKPFLSREMENSNKLTDIELLGLSNRFKYIMKFIRTHFGDDAFSKFSPTEKGLRRTSRFNAAVFDALTGAVSYSIDVSEPKVSSTYLENYKNLFYNTKFLEAINLGVGDKNKVVDRINLVIEAIK